VLSFRFHIVSLIAVFLALAIGIAAGSTFIDRAIVDSLQDRVDTVSANLDVRRAENEALDGQIDDLEAYVTETAPWLVEDRLNGRSIVVVAERGIADEPVEAQVELLRQAGAQVPGIVWLEPELTLADGADRDEAVAAFELDQGDAAEVQQQVLERVAAEDPAEAGQALATLVEAGFAALDTVGGEAVDPLDVRMTAGSVLLVTGQSSELGAGVVTAAAAAALVDGGANVLVGEVYTVAGTDGGEEVPARGDALAPILDDEELRDLVATDDALDLLRGRTAAVLALDELAAGRVSHVGFGAGADAPVPPLPGS
jgi:hypothetical protein